MSALANFHVLELMAAVARHAAQYDVCCKCLGVGCLPEHFGTGNSNAQPCPHCEGGWVPKQMSLPL